MRNKKILFLSLCTFFYFIFMYFLYYHNNLSKSYSLKLSKNWSVYNKSEKIFEREVPIYIGGKDAKFQKGVFRYETKFIMDDYSTDYVVVFPYILNQSYKLYINDKLIKSKGDILEGRSNQWYNPIIGNIPKNILKEENELRIEMFSSYESGIPITPYIKKSDEGKIGRNLLYLTFELLPYYQSGVIITLLIIFMYTSVKFRENLLENLFYFLSLFFFLMYSFDSHSLETLPFSYIWFKKITIISFYLSIFSSVLYFKRINNGKDKRLINLTLYSMGLFIFYLLSTPNIETAFRDRYENGYLVVFLYLITALKVIKNNKNNKYLSELKYGYYLLVIVAIHDSIALNFNSMSIVLFNNSMFIYIYYSAFLFLLNIISYYEELKIEKEKSLFYYNISRKDPLTGAYNRKRLDELEETLMGDYIVIYFDMDKFKQINDTYGHFAGDKALCEFVNLIKKKLSKDIDLIRVGGDEFVLILQEEERVVEDFLDYMIYKSENTEFLYEEEKIKIEFSLGFGKSDNAKELYQIINNADRLLYKRKKNTNL